MTVTVESPLPLAADREPGVYDGISLEEYHSDRTSLSSSGARKLLAPSCPALFRYDQDHPSETKDHLEFGSAMHAKLLGEGPELEIVDAASWTGKAAQTARRQYRAEGVIPLLPHQMTDLDGMVAAIRRHPIASALFQPGFGKAEQSLYWRDQETGVMCRARPDWLPDPTEGRLIVPDLKTTVKGDLDSLRKSIYKFGYHIQAPWYLSGIRALGLAVRPVFVFVFIEKTAPYLITIVQLDHTAMDIGRRQGATARHIFRECTETGRWPAYADDVEVLSLPAYIETLFK